MHPPAPTSYLPSPLHTRFSASHNRLQRRRLSHSGIDSTEALTAEHFFQHGCGHNRAVNCDALCLQPVTIVPSHGGITVAATEPASRQLPRHVTQAAPAFPHGTRTSSPVPEPRRGHVCQKWSLVLRQPTSTCCLTVGRDEHNSLPGQLADLSIEMSFNESRHLSQARDCS